MTAPSNISLDWHGDVIALGKLYELLPQNSPAEVFTALATTTEDALHCIASKLAAQARLCDRVARLDKDIADSMRQRMQSLSKAAVASGDAHESTM